MENGEKPDPGQTRAMQSDVLHWSGALDCWAVETAQGTLWVSKATFLREVREVLHTHDTSPEVATNRQFLDATATVQDPAYWDTIADPEITRFPAGEAPHGK